MSEEKKENEFSVNDKRGQEKEAKSNPELTVDASAKDESPQEASSEQATQLPEASFINFILSLGTSAMMHMGLVPEGHQADVNLPMAKHEIELLDMLAEKTKNNLDEKEAELLKQLLYELRLRYVESTKAS